MKKTILTISLLASCLLVSCSNPSNSSSSSTINENSNFPTTEIKSYLGVTQNPPTFEADDFETYTSEDGGIHCYLITTLKTDKANNTTFTSTLTNLGYDTPIYDDVNNYYLVEGSLDLGYSILFYEADYNSNTNFFVQYYSYNELYGDNNVGESEFPHDTIKEYFNVNESIPGYVASSYYVETLDELGLEGMILYSELSETANSDVYKTTLTNAGYTVTEEEDEYGAFYYAYIDENNGFNLYFYDYEDDNTFNIEIYYVSSNSSDTGGSTGGDEYGTSTSFPSTFIKETFETNSEFVPYSASSYTYFADVDDDGYVYVYIYSDKSNTANNDTYYQALSNAGYTISEEEDEYGVYYYAYNEQAGYELYFYEDSEYNSFDVQIYFFGESTSGGNGSTGGGDPVVANVEILSSHFTTSYPSSDTSFTVNNIEFKCYRVMASTQYKNTIQFSAQTKGSGYIYNVTPISSSTLIIDLNYSYNFIMNVYVGNSVKPTTTTLTPTVNGSVYTYDISGYSYIFIENVGNASYINSIKIA